MARATEGEHNGHKPAEMREIGAEDNVILHIRNVATALMRDVLLLGHK